MFIVGNYINYIKWLLIAYGSSFSEGAWTSWKQLLLLTNNSIEFNKHVISIVRSIVHEGPYQEYLYKMRVGGNRVNMITEINIMQFKYGHCRIYKYGSTNNMDWEFKEGRNHIQFRRQKVSIMKSHLR